jgi:hypothetical protein
MDTPATWAYKEPPTTQTRGGMVSVVYAVAEKKLISGGLHADDGETETVLAALKTDLEKTLIQNPPVTDRKDVDRCDVFCTVLDARPEDREAIIRAARQALEELLQGKHGAVVASPDGRFMVSGTLHGKNRAA